MFKQTDNKPRITSRGIQGRYFAALEAYSGASWIERVATRVPSDQMFEEYAMLGFPPGFRERIGPLLAKKLREYSYAIRNKKFESTMAIPNDWVKFDKTSQVDMRIAQHVERASGHDAENLSLLMANATGSAYGLCYDGQYFYDTDHVDGDSGSQSNLFTYSDVAALNIATATAPTAAEVVEAVMGVIGKMLTIKDDQGKLFNAVAKEFLVMVGVPLMGPFAAAFTGRVINTGNAMIDNTLLSINKIIDGLSISLAINPLMPSTTQFQVFRTDGPVKPLIIQEVDGPEMTVLDETSDHWKKEDEFLYILKRLCNWGFGLWQYAALATFN